MKQNVRIRMVRVRGSLATAGVLALVACATTGTGTTTGTPTRTTTAQGDVAPRDQVWPVVTREHVDLWLHGFAMLTSSAGAKPTLGN